VDDVPPAPEWVTDESVFQEESIATGPLDKPKKTG
jgi:hypothetical protein